MSLIFSIFYLSLYNKFYTMKKSLTHNKRNTPKRIVRKYTPGGILEKMNTSSAATLKDAFKSNNIASTIGGLGSGIMSVVDASMANGKVDTSKADNAIEAINNYTADSSNIKALTRGYSNQNFDTTTYGKGDFTVSTGEGLANMGKAGLSGFTTGFQTGGIWGGIAGLVGGLAASGGAWAGAAANEETELMRANREKREALAGAEAEAKGARDTYYANEADDFRLGLGTYSSAAFGGKLNKFNSFEVGGPIHQHGGIFSNDIITVDEGGTHEENPLEGVQMGVDDQGIPNLVEEGEVIWNDYVFSNRLKPTDEFKKKYKLSGETFADAARKAQEESAERPYDEISKRGLDDLMSKLMTEQEIIRANNNNTNTFAMGGNKNKKNRDTLQPLLDYTLDREYYVNQLGFPTVDSGKKAVAENKFKRYINDVVGGNNTIKISDIFNTISGKIADYKSGRKKKQNKYAGGSFLRYAPAIGSGLSVIGDMAGVTDKPDYSSADLIKESTSNLKDVTYTPTDVRLSETPMDTKFYYNQFRNQLASTNKAIQNAGGTPTATMANLQLANYNGLTQAGNLARQEAEYKAAQNEKIAGFNRESDIYNSTGEMKAAAANQANDKLRLQSAIYQAQLRDQADANASAAKSANWSNLFTNLGNIGTDNANRNQTDMMIQTGMFGTLSQKPYWWSDKQWADYQAGLTAQKTADATPTSKPVSAGTSVSYIPSGVGDPDATSIDYTGDPTSDRGEENDPYWYTRARGGKIKRRRKIKKGLTY